jgi:NADPH:quinone reductase
MHSVASSKVKTMKALRLEQFGAPSMLSLQDIEMPALQPGEVLVEVHAAAINPSDVKNVAGLFNASLPTTPGRDYAGVVVAGDAAWLGKKVWGSGAGFGMVRNGAHAQYLAVSSDWLSEMPAGLSMEQAAAVGAPYVTAWTALIDAARLQAGETVLITGAAGAVGQAATQIARWKKARVIGAVTSASTRPSSRASRLPES